MKKKQIDLKNNQLNLKNYKSKQFLNNLKLTKNKILNNLQLKKNKIRYNLIKFLKMLIIVKKKKQINQI